MLDKLRNSKYYKLCGSICGILTFLILFLSLIVYYLISLSGMSRNEAFFFSIPIFVVLFIISILNELLFIIFNILLIVALFKNENSKNDNSKENKPLFFTDVGYIVSFIIFFGFKIYFFVSDILSKLK